MTNFYLSAFAHDPIIRGAVMQSGDSQYHTYLCPLLVLILREAAQPMWPVGQQIGKIAANLSCPIGLGQLDCLRSKTGLELQKALLGTGAQFQPVTDNITVWKKYVFCFCFNS